MFIFFFFNDTATTEIYTLSLHDALPIFGGENHDLSASLHLGACGLGRFQVVQALIDPVPLELLEFGVEPGGEAHAISRMILPASPARMAARASSIFASGNWCVITGRGSSSPAVR